MTTADIQKSIEGFLEKGGFAYEAVECIERESMGPVFTIRSADSRFLIGPQGETLKTINFILKRIVQKQFSLDREPTFSVDVNDYREASLRQLEHKAKMMADRAISFRTTVELEPMSSYERLFVHALFSNHPTIKTESIGVGKDRRITLKFVENQSF